MLYVICLSFVKVWCILKDTGEADVLERLNAASRPLTVCTYPEVQLKQYLSSKTLNKTLYKVIRKAFFISVSFSLPLSPQVFVLSGVIAMVTCAVFLRLNSLLKLAVLLLAVAVYSYLIHLAFLTLTRHDVAHKSAADTHTHNDVLFLYSVQ